MDDIEKAKELLQFEHSARQKRLEEELANFFKNNNCRLDWRLVLDPTKGFDLELRIVQL